MEGLDKRDPTLGFNDVVDSKLNKFTIHGSKRGPGQAKFALNYDVVGIIFSFEEKNSHQTIT